MLLALICLINRAWKIFMIEKGKFVLHHSKQIIKNVVYVYYTMAWYYRKDKKPYREILKNLGRLTEKQITSYKIGIDYLNQKPKGMLCKIEDVVVRNSNDYLPCAIGDYFWDFWKLSSVFGNNAGKKAVATSDIAKILTIIRWVQTCSKSLTTELFSETCLPQLTGVSPDLYNVSRIFRELEHIEAKREALGKHIFKLAKQKGYTKGDVLFYDLSSGNLAGVRCVMAKWGHCKDGYRTHVVLMLVITVEGYPVYWELLEGNTPDVKTVEKLIVKVEKVFGKIESVLCFDRGMVSDENLNLLENRNKPIKFITALDGDQINHFKKFINFDLLREVKGLKLKTQAKQIKEKLTDGGFQFMHDNLFYRELCLTQFQKEEIEKDTLKLGLEKRRYFLAFNPELAYLTHKHRVERVEEFKEWVKDYNQELAKALSSRKESVVIKNIKDEMKKKKINNVEIDYKLTTYRVENKNEKGVIKKATTHKVVVDDVRESAYKESRKYDGIWMLITNIVKEDDKNIFNKTNFSSYFDIYRLKNNIEESFKILSQFVGMEPFYVYKTKHIQAHFTICVLSYLLDITIVNKIRASNSVDNMSLQRLFHVLKKCKLDIIQINEHTTISKLTQVTNKQKAILNVLNCNHLVDPDYLQKRNIFSIENKRA